MKKRLLITSIVMMLVVAVALSTATYAWFTSNARVDAAQISLKAAVSDASAIGIGWQSGEAGTSIESDLYEVLKPMAPASLTVGTTTPDVLFYNGTVRQEDSQFVFNGVTASYVLVSSLPDETNNAFYTKSGSTRVAKAGVKYYTSVGDVIPDVVTVDSTDVSAKYVTNFAPVIYNNEEVQQFYVKNLSDTNTVSKITAYANFTASDTYIQTKDTTARKGSTYYTRQNNGTVDAPDYSYTEIEVVDSNATTNQIVVGTTVNDGNYFEKINGNDLIRVALFTKGPQDSGLKLLCVLGSAATEGTAATAFDKNTTYYTRTGTAQTGYTYLQDKEVTADNFATKDAVGEGLFTCANTAVYGASTLFDDDVTVDPVKDLDHYTNVVTSYTLATNLAPLNSVEVVAVAWLDGTLLDDSKAGVLGQVSLYFQVG